MADYSNIFAFNNRLRSALPQAVVIGLSSGRALLDNRIFGKGLDSSNKPIGQYKSKSYKEYRERRGRQTGFVDLRLEGDLQNSIQVIPISLTETGIGFLTSEQTRKANYNTDRFEKDIFSFSDGEVLQVYNIIVDELGRLIS